MLVNRARRGLADPRVFAEVFDRHYAAVAGFLRRRLDPALADELAAETFLQAFDGRRRYGATHCASVETRELAAIRLAALS